MHCTTVVHIQSRKHALDHADYTVSTRPRELDSADQEYVHVPKHPEHEVGIGDRSVIPFVLTWRVGVSWRYVSAGKNCFSLDLSSSVGRSHTVST